MQPSLALRTTYGLFALCMLYGCSHTERSAYVERCSRTNIGTPSQCACIYELSQQSLTEKQHQLFLAISLGDDPEAAKIRADLGVLATAAAMAQIAWVAANAVEACNVNAW